MSEPTKAWKAVVDRIEGATAVVLVGEAETPVDIPVMLLPDGVQEGSHLRAAWQLDPKATQAAETRVKSLLEQLLAQTNSQNSEEHD